MFNKTIKLFFGLLLIAITVSACSISPKEPEPIIGGEDNEIQENTNNEIEQTENKEENNEQEEEIEYADEGTGDIKEFKSIDELQTFIKTHQSTEALMYALDRGSMTKGMVSESISSTNTVTHEAGDNNGNSIDFSDTNNQVQGVDEPDIVKMDSNYAYVLVKDKLSIISLNPIEDAHIVSSITFKSRPIDIYINGNNLVVFGYENHISKNFMRGSSYNFFKVFDVSDRSNPKQVRDLDIEGNYIDSRMIGDYVYLITNNYVNYFDSKVLIPNILSNGVEVIGYKPSIFYFDIPYSNYSFTTITAINVKNNKEKINGEVFLLDGNQNLYVSQDNIYITYTKYLNEYSIRKNVTINTVTPVLSDEDKEKVKEIKNVPDYILNNREKENKISLIIQTYLNSLSSSEQKDWDDKIEQAFKEELLAKAKDREKTIIYKIAIKDSDITFKAKGEVEGRVLNQFSMDEYNGYFRIATTRSKLWSSLTKYPNKSYSNVFVLSPKLDLIGSLKNIATDERIYSARFMGNRVYLVTFKETDPVYAISLKNLKEPKILGSIKVPGYSNYLHPMDANGNQLIGLGRDVEVDPNGRTITKGIKLSLFDFSDLKNPKELDNVIIGDRRSNSIALYDHKAFLYSGNKHIISIPVVFRDDQSKLAFSGAIVLNAQRNSLSLKGKIDHSDGGHFDKADYWHGYNYYDNTVKRSRYFGDNLLTFSNKYLKINRISDLNTVKNVKLIPDDPNDFIIEHEEEGIEDVIVPEESVLEMPTDEPMIDESMP